jgi:tetratricopeptide (TPR) repeat protein
VKRRRPTPSTPSTRARPVTPAYVASELELDAGLSPMSQEFLDGVAEVKALTVAGSVSLDRTLADVRGYAKRDLFALAEVGYHYLMNGANDLARIIFEGLAAVDPTEAYFALGFGLALDNDGDVRGAMAAYQRAARLDPTDARPDINRAELYIMHGDPRSAGQLLDRALEKARRTGDMELFRKAKALRTRIARMEARR